MKKYKIFLLTLPILTLVMIAFYMAFAMFLIRVSSAHHYAYKNYLISNTTEQNRIIVESGSNSYHGINSQMLEKHFGKLVINLADHGGYPLRHRLYRAAKLAHKGDIFILPLEYRYYINDVPPDTYYYGLFFEIHHFYDYLPFFEKLKTISQIPFQAFINAAIRDYKEIAAFEINFDNFINRKPQAVHDFSPDFRNGERGDYKYIGKVEEAKDTQMPCQKYIFFTDFSGGKIGISDIFKENLNFMKKLEREKGIKFIFTYPAVAGDDCYDLNYPHAADNQKFLKDVKKLIEDNGFEMIGDYKDSSFPRKFLHDTWFHLVPEARDMRTQKLIENLEKSKYAKELHAK